MQGGTSSVNMASDGLMADLKVCELIDECPNYGTKYRDGGRLDNAVNRREEQRAWPDADHVQPN